VSASVNRTASPRDARKPCHHAPFFPIQPRGGCAPSLTESRGSAADRRRRMARVASVELSSTTMISIGTPAWARSDLTHRSMFISSFRAGTTIETDCKE